MCYDVVSETAPPYLSDLLHLHIPSRSSRSSADTRTFPIPKRKKTFQGQGTFFPIWVLSHGINSHTLSAMLQQNPRSKLNSKPHYCCQPMDQTQLKTTLLLSAHGPKSTQNHTAAVSPWTKLLNLIVFTANRTPTPQPHHFLLTCLYRCVHAARVFVCVSVCRVRVCVRACACVRACVRACVCACVCMCECVCVCVCVCMCVCVLWSKWMCITVKCLCCSMISLFLLEYAHWAFKIFW